MKIKIKHDKQAQAAYIKLRDTKHDRTAQLDEDVLADYDADGRVIGIEITHATEIENEEAKPGSP